MRVKPPEKPKPNLNAADRLAGPLAGRVFGKNPVLFAPPAATFMLAGGSPVVYDSCSRTAEARRGRNGFRQGVCGFRHFMT